MDRDHFSPTLHLSLKPSRVTFFGDPLTTTCLGLALQRRQEWLRWHKILKCSLSTSRMSPNMGICQGRRSLLWRNKEELEAYLEIVSLSQVFSQLNYAFISIHFLQVPSIIVEASFVHARGYIIHGLAVQMIFLPSMTRERDDSARAREQREELSSCPVTLIRVNRKCVWFIFYLFP